MTEPPATRIAANLRHLRERGGLSIVALAERSGVARATLTKLEAGKGNPTVDTLYALADALGVALGEVIGAAPPARISVIRSGEGSRVHGAISARLVDRVHGHRLTELYEIGFSIRTRHADPHPTGVVEQLFVTAGRVRVGPADEPVELGPGDFIRFPGDVAHLYQALGGPAQGVLVMTQP